MKAAFWAPYNKTVISLEKKLKTIETANPISPRKIAVERMYEGISSFFHV